MKLSELAKRAAALPDLEFDWAGPEQYSDYNFERATATPETQKLYLNELRRRLGEQSFALHKLANGYRQMRDLILEAEVG